MEYYCWSVHIKQLKSGDYIESYKTKIAESIISPQIGHVCRHTLNIKDFKFCNKGLVLADPPPSLVKDHTFTIFFGPFPKYDI